MLRDLHFRGAHIQAGSLSFSPYIYIYIYISSFSVYKGPILDSKSQNDFGTRLVNMHHTSLDETLANRAANEELFNDLMRLEERLENIQNLHPSGKVHLVIIMSYTLTISLL